MQLFFTTGINVTVTQLKALYAWGVANGFAADKYHASEILKALAHSLAETHLQVEGVRLDCADRFGRSLSGGNAASPQTPPDASSAAKWWMNAGPGERAEMMERVGAECTPEGRFLIDPLVSPTSGASGN